MPCKKCHAFSMPVVIAASLMAAGCAGTPQDGAGGAPAAVVTRSPKPGEIFQGPDGRQMRCIYEAETGTRVPQRTCRSLDEWAQIEEAAKQYGRDMQGPMTGAPEQ